VPRYSLSIGEQADLNLHRLAQELHLSEVDVLRNAINTYATVKRRTSDGYVWVHVAIP
jgi:23S rRNA A2030 N6-methylase RlmJ